MAAKPKFDPSKPFEPVSNKPAFDPSKSFDVVTIEKPNQQLAANEKVGFTKPSLVAELGKQAIEVGKPLVGVAAGAGESFNPLNIPHGLETLARKITPGVSNEAVIPELRIGETVAPALRAGVRGLIDAIQLNSPEFSKKFQEEKANQAAFEKTVGKTAINAGELGASIIALGSLGTSALKALKAGKALKNIANTSAYQSLKPLGKAADRVVDQGRAQAIGEQLLKDNIVTPNASYKNILSRVTSKLSDYGEQIGFYAKSADKAVASDSSIRGINVPDLIDDINKGVVRPLSADPSTTNIAKQVSDWAVDLKNITKNEDLGFQQAQKLKKSLDAMKAKFGRGGDSLAKEAFQDVYRILNNKIEQGIESALSKAAPQLTNNFKEVKNAYRNLADAKAFISKTVARADKNRFLSLTDYGSGMAAAITGGVVGGPLGASAAIPAAIANKLLRTKGLQFGAGTAQGLSNIIEGSNLSSIKAIPTASGLLDLIRSNQNGNQQ